MSKHNKNKSRKNPVGPGVALLGVAAVAGAGYLAWDYMESQKKPAKKKADGGGTPGRARLSGVYAENATLGNAPAVLSAIALPLSLGQVGAVQLRSGDNIAVYNTMTLNPGMVRVNGKTTLDISWKDALKRMVTNMTKPATEKAFALFTDEAAAGADLSTVSPALDQAIIKALTALAPSTNWSTGLAPYAGNSVEAYVWTGLALVAALAHQSYKNKNGEAPVPDGWPSDEEIPEDLPLTPDEQAVVDDMTQKFNGQLSFYVKGPAKVIERETVAILIGDSGFSAIEGIFADDQTKATGEFLGLAFYTSKDKEAGFSYRSAGSASLPSETDRINQVRDKLMASLSTIQDSL